MKNHWFSSRRVASAAWTRSTISPSSMKRAAMVLALGIFPLCSGQVCNVNLVPGNSESPQDMSPDASNPSASTKLQASLDVDGVSSGKAEWEVHPDQSTFHVEIESGVSGDILDIIVDGFLVGQLTLNDSGYGEIEFQDPPDDNPGPNEFPLPDGFPDIGEGSTVTVGTLSSEFLIVVDDSGTDDSMDDDDDGTDDSGNDDADGGDDDHGSGNDLGDSIVNQLKAALGAEGTTHGGAEWEVRTDRSKFSVEIESGTPNDVLDIIVDGFAVGQLTLNDIGFGEIEFQDPPDDNPGPHEFPLPADFPDIGEGSMVMVGTLSGEFQIAIDDSGSDDSMDDDDDVSDDTGDDDIGQPDNAVLSRLEATLGADGATHGQAEWEVRADRSTFKVEIKLGMSNDVLDIIVDGFSVGQLTLDDFGSGEIEFQDPLEDNPGPHEFALPDGFPDISAGSMVTVGALSSDFQIVVDDSESGDSPNEGVDGGDNAGNDGVN